MTNPRAKHFSALDEQLETALKTAGDRPTTTVVVGEADPVELPPESLKMLHKLVHTLATGSDVMLTTTQTADVLGVSRPYLTRLLKASKLPYLTTGNRHHVPLTAVHDFATERQRKLDELDGIAATEQDLESRDQGKQQGRAGQSPASMSSIN